MDWDREERERAIQEADRLKAEFERDEWLRAQRANRSAPVGTYEPRPIQRQPGHTMDAATQAAWDQWIKTHIAIALEEHLKKVLVPSIGKAMSDYVHARLETEITKLRDELTAEIGALRADQAVDRAVIKGEVAQFKSKSNAA